MTFADWFHFQRRKRRIRQEDLAVALGLSPQTVSAWETGRSIPRLTPWQTKTFCEQLGCDLDELTEACKKPDLASPQFEHSLG